MGQKQQEETIDELIRQLRDYRTRGQARRRLYALGQDAAPKLMEILPNEDEKTNTRWAALRLLADAGYQEAQQPILNVARESENLCGEACRALKTLTDQDFGEDLDQWDAFLKGEIEPGESTQEADAETQEAEQQQPQEEKAGESKGTHERVMPLQEEYDLVENALAARAQEITLEEDYIYLHLPVSSERTQQLIISFTQQTETGERFANFYTRCGRSDSEKTSLVNYCNERLTYGQAYVEAEEADKKILAISEKITVADLDDTTLETIVTTLGEEADQLENELTDKDRI